MRNAIVTTRTTATVMWLWALALSGGCLGLNAFPRELTQIAQGMAEMVRDQGVLDEFKSNVDGNVQDPGLETAIAVIFKSHVRLIGVNGEIDLATEGTGTKLPAGVREELLRQLAGPISDEQRQAILTLLGWNRAQTGGS